MTADQRVFLLKRLTILFLVIGMVYSFPLWLNERDLTLIPPFEFLGFLKTPWDIILLVITGVLLLANFLLVNHKFSSYALLFAILFLLGQDYNRFQPWVWQYLWLLVMVIPFSAYYKIYREREHLYHAILLGFVAVYIWAGTFKINPYFVDYVYPYMLWPVTNHLVNQRDIIHFTGHFLPYCEILLGIGLLIPKTRKLFVILGMGFHGFLMLLFSPIGLNQNLIIIPWNGFLFLALPLLFWGYQKPLRIALFPKLPFLSKLALFVFLALPILNFFNLYNKALSFEVYSGTNEAKQLRWPKSQVKNIPDGIEKHAYAYGDTIYVKNYNWAMESCHIPPNPDPKVWEKANKEVLKRLQ